jgi:hypothetical protein
VWTTVEEKLQTEMTADDLRNYIEVMKYWHPYEFLTVFGLGMIAPFALTLRSQNILIPYAYLWSPESDVGKTLSAKCASVFLWGNEGESGQALMSEFRFASYMDSCCLPVLFDEAELIKPELFPSMKQAAESANANRRGMKNLDTVGFLSRAVPILTGNAQSITSAEMLKRMVIARFDSARRHVGADIQKKVESATSILKPIGYAILREYLTTHNELSGLIKEIKEYESQFRQWPWKSPKRPECWAVIYLGLKIFENSCIKHGIEWRVPDIGAFHETIALPVESSTWSSTKNAIEAFSNWFEMWRVQNTRTRNFGGEEERSIMGENDVWKEFTLVFERNGQKENIPGFLILQSLLDTYNKATKNSHELIPTVSDLTQRVSNFYGIPLKEITEEIKAKGNTYIEPKRHPIGKRQGLRPAFLPDPSYFIQHPMTGEKEDRMLSNFDEDRKPIEVKKEPILEGVPVGLPPMNNPQSQNPPLEPLEASKPEEVMETTVAPKSSTPEIDTTLKNDISIQQTMPDLIKMPEKPKEKEPDNGNDMPKRVPEGQDKEILTALMEAMVAKLNPESLEHRQRMIQEGIKYMKSLKSRGKQTRPHLLRQTLVEKFPEFLEEAVAVSDSGFNIMEKFSSAFSQFQNGKSLDRSLLQSEKPREILKNATGKKETPEKETPKKWTEQLKKLNP